MHRKIIGMAAAFALLLGSVAADASVVIAGTRVIYPAKDREVTVRLNNEGDSPALVQVWLDAGNAAVAPDEAKVPFTLSPPLFRLDPKKGQSLRLVYTQEPLPLDKETLFWLNMLEVPPRGGAVAAGEESPNLLQLAFRTRVKLFFRPAGLAGDANDAAKLVTWKLVRGSGGGHVLAASNPTPYYVTFSHLVVTSGASSWTVDKGAMVDPGTTAEIDIGNPSQPAEGAESPLQVDYTFVNDYGAGVSGQYSSKKPKP